MNGRRRLCPVKIRYASRASSNKPKHCHKALKDGNDTAIARARPYFDNPAAITLQQAQLVIAREAGFDSWKQLLETGPSPDAKIAYCSFCGKSQHEVTKLIAGPKVYVCNECIGLCNDILEEELADAPVEIPVAGVEMPVSKLRLAISRYRPSARLFVRVVQQ